MRGSPASDARAPEAAIRRLSHDTTNRKILSLAAPRVIPGARVLDLGAGEGYFSQLLGELVRDRHGQDPAGIIRACDAVPDQFRYDPVPCDAVGADGRLPYEDATFDLVCSLEVIEHVEDQFGFLREAYRVLKPGAALLLSTPNVLNMNSRWRYLHSGFAQLFDPLPLGRRDIVHTSGHIHPVSYYYLAYAARAAGFRDVTVHFDHFKRSAVLQLLLLGPAILLGRTGFLLRMRRKRPREVAENQVFISAMNSLAMLTSRSVILAATK
jgi:ubiquinone/menaquinone biosynthesis C-methylase UbiE